jgi:hypothetical protein
MIPLRHYSVEFEQPHYVESASDRQQAQAGVTQVSTRDRAPTLEILRHL